MIKPTKLERQLKAQLEPIVASELPALFKAALAWPRIRNSRLFRTEATTFALPRSKILTFDSCGSGAG
jgi:hypothetical protein